MLHTEFGTAFKEMREKAGITQTKLAESINVSTGLISKYEKGERRPRRSIIFRVQKALKLSATEANKLFVAASHLPPSKEGVETNYPSVIPIVAYLSNPEISEQQKMETQIQLKSFMKIKEGQELAKKLRVERKWKDGVAQCDINQKEIENLTANLKWHGLNDHALLLYHLGYVVEAEEKFRQALEISKQTNNRTLEIDDLIHIGDIARLKGEWKQAENFYNEVIKIAESFGASRNAKKGKGLALRKLAETLLFQGYAQDAQLLLEDSLEIFRKIKDKYEEGKTHASMGWVYDQKGQWELALHSKELGLELSGENANDEYNIMKSHLYLGDSYFIGGKLEDAKKCYEESFDLSKRLSGPLERSLIESGLAMTYQSLGKIDKALEYYSASRSSAVILHSPYRIGLAQYGLGTALLQHPNRWQEAKPILQDAQRQFEDTETTYYLVLTMISLIEYYLKSAAYKEAKDTLAKINEKVYAERRIHSPLLLSKLAILSGKTEILSQNPDASSIADSFANAYIQASKFNEHFLNTAHSDILLTLRVFQQRRSQIWLTTHKELIAKLKNDNSLSMKSGILNDLVRYGL